jgi:hypothetical protein
MGLRNFPKLPSQSCAWQAVGLLQKQWRLGIQKARGLIEHISRGNDLEGPKVLGWLL